MVKEGRKVIRKRAFRLDSDIKARICVGESEQEHCTPCRIVNISESGCKLSAAGSFADDLPIGENFFLRMETDPSMGTLCRIVRHIDEIPNWGIIIGAEFADPSGELATSLRSYFKAYSKGIESEAVRLYRRHRRNRQLKSIALFAAAIIFGVAATFYIRQLPEKIDSALEAQKQEALKAQKLKSVYDKFHGLPESERGDFLKSLSEDDLQRLKSLTESSEDR